MMTEYLFGEGEEAVRVGIVRSRRKSLGLEVKTDGEVKARVPERISDRAILRFLQEHEDWIRKKTALIGKAEEARGAVLRPGELSAEARREFSGRLNARVKEYAACMGVTYGRVSLRFQKTRWGSCSSSGNLNFNYALALVPEKLADYVIVHELAHRRHMNHSADFWAEVERYFPEYKECRRELRRYQILG